MHVGIARHLGWAVAVTATTDHRVVDRRRIELIEPGVPTAPIHHDGGAHPLHRTGDPLEDHALAALVADVRASAVRATSRAFDELASSVPDAIATVSIRAWPSDFPDDIAVLRRVPYESRADSVMYLQVLAGLALDRGWSVHCYDAKHVQDEAVRVLGAGSDAMLRSPRATWGAPWTKDHRTAFAATIVVTASRC